GVRLIGARQLGPAPRDATAVLVTESTRAGKELLSDAWVGDGRARGGLRAVLTVGDGGGEGQHSHERDDAVHEEHATAARGGVLPPRPGALLCGVEHSMSPAALV